MLKKILLIQSLLWVGTELLSQTFYYYDNKKIEIVANDNYLFVVSKEKTVNNNLNNQFIIENEGTETDPVTGSEKHWKKLRLTNHVTHDENRKLVALLKNDPNIVYVGPVFGYQKPVAAGEYFYAKIIDATSIEILEQQAKKLKFEIVGALKESKNWYKLKASKNSLHNGVELTNLLFETGKFTKTDPGFMLDFSGSCNTEYYWGEQWALDDMTSNGFDIDICGAWDITKGNADVKVAVVDLGIDDTHSEFANTFSNSTDSYDAKTGTSPASIVYSNGLNYGHGTHVAGIIGANQNGDLISGVAPETGLMSVNHDLEFQQGLSEQLANGINWAWQNGASVINCSWGDKNSIDEIEGIYPFLKSALLEDAIESAMLQGRNGLGTIVVFASGNEGEPMINYPARFDPRLLCVGAMTSLGERADFSNYGVELDVVAPGKDIFSTMPDNLTGYMNGTSQAAPFVSGLAALILAVNPGLSRQKVIDIIEQTARKINTNYQTVDGRNNGTWEEKTGYGLIQATAAVQLAYSLTYTDGVDLYMNDNQFDYGLEPFVYDEFPYYNLTSDIWIRNQPDGLLNQTSQDPEFSATNELNEQNFVYVRIRNRGTEPSPAQTYAINFYWSKLVVHSNWPENWNGQLYLNGYVNGPVLAGDFIVSAEIPEIPSGEEVIIELGPWNPPSPYAYAHQHGWSHNFSVLAKINTVDGLENDYFDNSPNPTMEFARLNNNVAYTNIVVQDNINQTPVGDDCESELLVRFGNFFEISNPDKISSKFDIIINPTEKTHLTPNEMGYKTIVYLDNSLYASWVKGGKKGVEINDLSKMKSFNFENAELATLINSGKQLFYLETDQVIFNNVELDPNRVYVIGMLSLYNVDAKMQVKELSYSLSQKEQGTGKITNTVFYKSSRPDCQQFILDNSEIRLNKGCSGDISIVNPSTCMNSYWFDWNYKLISEENTVIIKPLFSQDYIYIGIDENGCVSKEKINAMVSSLPCKNVHGIIEISPNPASEKIEVKYDLGTAKNGVIKVINLDKSINKTYSLDANKMEFVLDVSSYPRGSYSIALMVDNQVLDIETVILR